MTRQNPLTAPVVRLACASLALLAALALFAAVARAGQSSLMEPTHRNAVSMIAALSIYQDRCLHGKPLPPGYSEAVGIFLTAAGLDMTSERVGAEIKVEMVRQILQVEAVHGKYCPEDNAGQ